MRDAATGPRTCPSAGQLLHDAKEGNRGAFGRFITQELPKLRDSVTAYLRLRNREDWVEDVCQDTIVKLLAIIGRSDTQELERVSERLSAYLYSIAIHSATDRFRSERRKSTIKKIEADRLLKQSDRQRDYDLNRELAEALIALLPSTYQPYFRLRYLDGCEPEEAALTLHISTEAAYKREQRGMLQLKRLMDADPKLATRIRGPM